MNSPTMNRNDAAAPSPDDSQATRVVTTVAQFLAPTAVLTAILYYFGWVRTEAAARALGVDQSLLGYGTSEYVLRSAAPLIKPLGLALIGLVLFIVISAVARHQTDRWVAQGRLTVRWLDGAVMILVTLAIALVVLSSSGLENPANNTSWTPVFLLLTAAACLLAARGGASVASDVGPSMFSASMHQHRTWLSSLAVGLITIAVFAFVMRTASLDGRGSIASMIATVDTRPTVSLTSPTWLRLESEGVEQFQTGPADDPLYHYEGLSLIIEANDRLFLIDTTTLSIHIVPHSADVQMDFHS